MPQRIAHGLVKALHAAEGFDHLDERTLLTLVAEATNLLWPAGATVFSSGDPAEGCYVVMSGRVVLDGSDGEHEVGPGASLGELAKPVQPCSARALTPCELMVIPRHLVADLALRDVASPDH